MSSYFCNIGYFKEVTTQLISLMWYDFSRTVKKVASQTLGRTGRGREVHEEIFLRLKDGDTFDKTEALKKINAIGKSNLIHI